MKLDHFIELRWRTGFAAFTTFRAKRDLSIRLREIRGLRFVEDRCKAAFAIDTEADIGFVVGTVSAKWQPPASNLWLYYQHSLITPLFSADLGAAGERLQEVAVALYGPDYDATLAELYPVLSQMDSSDGFTVLADFFRSYDDTEAILSTDVVPPLLYSLIRRHGTLPLPDLSAAFPPPDLRGSAVTPPFFLREPPDVVAPPELPLDLPFAGVPAPPITTAPVAMPTLPVATVTSPGMPEQLPEVTILPPPFAPLPMLADDEEWLREPEEVEAVDDLPLPPVRLLPVTPWRAEAGGGRADVPESPAPTPIPGDFSRDESNFVQDLGKKKPDPPKPDPLMPGTTPSLALVAAVVAVVVGAVVVVVLFLLATQPRFADFFGIGSTPRPVPVKEPEAAGGEGTVRDVDIGAAGAVEAGGGPSGGSQPPPVGDGALPKGSTKGTAGGQVKDPSKAEVAKPTVTCFEDRDKDGIARKGSEKESRAGTKCPAGFVDKPGEDCDDQDPKKYPGAKDYCEGDVGVDADCDPSSQATCTVEKVLISGEIERLCSDDRIKFSFATESGRCTSLNVEVWLVGVTVDDPKTSLGLIDAKGSDGTWRSKPVANDGIRDLAGCDTREVEFRVFCEGLCSVGKMRTVNGRRNLEKQVCNGP